MNKTFLLLSALLSLSINAAEGDENPSSTKQPWSIAFQYGAGEANGSQIELGSVLNAGGNIEYHTAENISFKLGFLRGSDSFTNALVFNLADEYDFQSSYFAVSARSSESLHVFGSIGLASTTETIDISGPDVKKDSTNLYYDVGVGWDVNQHFTMSILYARTDAELADIASTMAQISYRF